MTRRYFTRLASLWPISLLTGCSKPVSFMDVTWPSYPEKMVNGTLMTDMYDVHLWQVKMRQYLAKKIPATEFSTCEQCGMPWWVVEGHNISFAPGSACFPICEMCWNDANDTDNLLPYYVAWVTKNYPGDSAKLEMLKDNFHKRDGGYGGFR